MVRIAAVADLHTHEDSPGHFRPLFERVNEEADFLVLAGDLTNSGYVQEAEILASELEDVRIPIVAVLGNHDCESDQEHDIARFLRSRRNWTVLDGDSATFEIQGKQVGFAGTKGFGGGFAKYAIDPFGERALKDFVHASLKEARKIEEALSNLQSDYRIAILHYAPIRETLVGESPELWPFLGSSHLVRVVDKLGADVVFHGHGHYGTPSGRTETGIPVFNVALRIVHRYRIYELE